MSQDKIFKIFGKFQNFKTLFIPLSLSYCKNSQSYFLLNLAHFSVIFTAGSKTVQILAIFLEFGVFCKQTPEVGTITSGSELILPWIESIYRCLSSPGTRCNICTHRLQYTTQILQTGPNLGPEMAIFGLDFGYGRNFRPHIGHVGGHMGVGHVAPRRSNIG